MRRTARARPLDVPLDGDLLVEASAGTGKTYALTTLVARLIVESGRRIDDLLIVTFTVAATGELRTRIRGAIRDALDLARGNGQGQGLGAELIRRWGDQRIDQEEIVTRLTSAIRDFDRANVMTIHGFCQRALTEFGFDARIPFGLGVTGDDAGDVAAAVRDFWRTHIAPEPIPLLEVAQAARFELDSVSSWVGRHHAKPSVIRGGADFARRFASANNARRASFQAAREAWGEPEQQERFLDALDTLTWNQNENTGRLDEVRRAFDANDPDLLPLGHAGYFGRRELSTKLSRRRAQELPDIPLYDHFEALGNSTDQICQLWLPDRRRRVLEATRSSLRHDTWKYRHLSFNAMLTELDHALAGEAGETLAQRLRARYPVALIDEFQDTDRLQARIFETIYPSREARVQPARAEGGLMIVGDPKQSIYRFRGADVFAYLGATAHRRDMRKLSLQHNYRSSPTLLRAVNALFDRGNPFLRPEQITFEQVQAAPRGSEHLRIRDQGMDPKPFQLRLFPGAADGRVWTKGTLTEVVAEQAADEIAELLALARDGKAAIHRDATTRLLAGGDIAVLVRTGEQGRIIARKLRERGVQSVEMGIDSVFETLEATQLKHLLRALAADPAEYNFPSMLRGALATDLFGLTMSDLAELQDDDDTWASWTAWAQDCRDTWSERGVATLIRRLLFDENTDCAAHLLEYPDGARRLTNVLHLTELMQEAETGERLSPQGLVEWLARASAHPEPGDEGTQLRLESDEQLVKIVTIHRSKGLEFPVVFCPFAWFRRRRRTERTVEYHELDGDFTEILDLNPSSDARAREWIEDQADELRLMYVALTRAKYRCVVTWARATDSQNAPLAWLIHRPELRAESTLGEQLDANAAHVKSLDSTTWLSEVERFAEGASDAIATTVLDGAASVPRLVNENLELPGLEPLAARTLGRTLRRIRQRTSFSALTSDMGAAVTSAEHEDVDQPDHDQDDAAIEEESAAPARATGDRLDVFTFPSGFRPGNCLHEMFERNVEPGADLDDICRDVLAKYRIDAKWVPAARTMVENTLNAPLESQVDGRVFRVGEVERPIAEMEFHLPLYGMDRARLARCFAAHGYSHGIPDSASGIDGFLHGFIDVVARHGDRWYVMDYKSNWLGDNIHAYSGQAVRAAMAAHGYAAQYLFYLTALHRFLRLRLPDYDYERHVGGVFYLFVRGMSPEIPGQGVYRDAPTRACIEAIDACFKGATA
ncbi:MAG: exodeoxyribonuclease V subunit beta [Gammaproteobacteria bacterium]|nr:exodeoxyribonuclease V subunit beta [Gammaproteobacteria bacterium]